MKIFIKYKNEISIISLVLIVNAFLFKFAFGNELIFNISLIIASIINFFPIAIQSYQAIRVKVISIDLLVSIAIIGAVIIGNFEESAIVSFLFLFGAFLEQKTLNKTKKAITDLTEISPIAYKLVNGEYVETNIDDILEEDTLLIKTGSQIPVDGVIISGDGYINEATITGESMPVFKEKGSEVFAGSILENGTLTIKALKVGYDTTFSKIIELIEDAQDSKSQTEVFINKFATYYTPFVLLLSLVIGLIYMDLELAITILVLGCPGALVIGIPIAHIAGIGRGARDGILFKGSEVISNIRKLDTIIFDKTGTLTTGNPVVREVKLFGDESYASDYLVTLEKESNHPLANAIINYYPNTKPFKTTNTNVIRGKGIVSEIDGKEIVVGNEKLLNDLNIILKKDEEETINNFLEKGYTLVIMAIDKKLEMIIGVSDTLRTNSLDTINHLRRIGVKKLILLSGDNNKSVQLVKEELNLDFAIGNMMPEDKADYVKELKSKGEIVAFVGDGINDGPSLALADVAISMSSGTDVAIETSDVVIIDQDFNKLPEVIRLSKGITNVMVQNISIALLTVAFLIVGLVASSWMNMAVGMLFHELSILIVILNGMRLLRKKRRNRK